MLSHVDLAQLLDSGGLVIDPPGVMQPASIDLTLADGYGRLTSGPYIIDAEAPPERSAYTLGKFSECGYIHHHTVTLASTAETVTIPLTHAARFEGKSSLGRIGLSVHVTAGFIDPGFTGRITLELTNVSGRTIVLRPGMAIGQLCLFKLQTACELGYGHPSYGSKYQGQTVATPARAPGSLGTVIPNTAGKCERY